MMFHPNAEEAFNKKAFELISHMTKEVIINEPNQPQSLKGSMAHKQSEDWSDKLDRSRPSISSKTNLVLGTKFDRFEEHNGQRVGFNEEKYPEYEKFLDQIYKTKTISQKVSYSWLYDESFQWFANVCKTGQANTDFTTFITSQAQIVLSTYNYRFEIINLDIQREFKIGNISFSFLTEAYFDNLSTQKPLVDIAPLKEKYCGNVYASISIQDVEIKKGEEIAFNECCKAVNILKLFSPTVQCPTYKTDFDIDRRVRVNLQNECLIEKSETNDLSMNFERGATHYQLIGNIIDGIEVTCLNFSTLIKIKEPNELQKLVVNGLALYSDAISNPNIHKRIVDLLTIWESLLLKDSNSPIMDTVSTYASKLLRKTVDDRKVFIAFFKEIYAIRSAVIHHAKETDLDMKKVALFQSETINLMETLINASQKHHTKQSLLTEIDNAILQAY